jgi:hypothetical protein
LVGAWNAVRREGDPLGFFAIWTDATSDRLGGNGLVSLQPQNPGGCATLRSLFPHQSFPVRRHRHAGVAPVGSDDDERPGLLPASRRPSLPISRRHERRRCESSG